MLSWCQHVKKVPWSFCQLFLYKEPLSLALLSFGIQGGNKQATISTFARFVTYSRGLCLERSRQAFHTPRAWQNITDKEVHAIAKRMSGLSVPLRGVISLCQSSALIRVPNGRKWNYRQWFRELRLPGVGVPVSVEYEPT